MKTLLTLYMIICSLSSTVQAEWSNWKKSPCYDKVEYRYRHVRAHGTRQIFEIQFKNRYGRTIYFDYALAGSKQNEDIHHARRTSLPANRESKPIPLFTNSEEFLIEIGQLNFSPYDTEYEECDQEAA
ncbi:hypothetical protein H8B06_13750 [Sphingobacterium sp. DN00404]|uniref:Uncharacterized protein n=1 Tax=Sphingobacterium micropteri TaxID=2763501 RepID=A0ABR7YRD9_9SPHI|nr:hypothetical protein [Sphingobacterium micropteri]MBD1433897.1 hypothetical protein [Sphingobacterium micropteri]